MPRAVLYCGFGHRINNGQGTAVRLYHPGKEGKNLFRGDILIGNRSGITQFLLGEGLGVLPYLFKLFRDSGYAGMYRFAPQTNV